MSERRVIWPVYLDSARTRSQGRAISKEEAVKGPTLKEIEGAASALGLDPVVEPEKSYPASWWEESGRVLVDSAEPKSVTVRRIAGEIGKDR
ncbi:MAG: Signal recognition particle 19 kDa protein [Methanonatronarchaeales archaeon]|nr:Signal recognition particle 19 kDa protein [Methanonatronarchaeales archaeon]